MSSQDPGRPASPALTSLPRLEDLPRSGEGMDPDAVRDAFDSFRRHAAQLQAQLRVLQAAGRTQSVDPTGHAVRMDALHLIRAAAEFADALERDAQNASAAQLGRTEEEVRRRQIELQEREAELERYRAESERERAEILNTARNEARTLLADANRDATQELREAEARGARLLEQARHQATELTNSARAEVEQTLEWARAQAAAVLARAQHGAEQLLSAAGLGDDAIAEVSDAIMRAAEEAMEASRQTGSNSRRGPDPAAVAPAAALSGPPVSADPETEPRVSPKGEESAGEDDEPSEPPVTPGEPPSAAASDDEDDRGSPTP
jgi:F0F1-type ATP synthase membrane subunit b/b'